MTDREREATRVSPSSGEDDAVMGELRRAIECFDPVPANVAVAGRTTLARALLARDLPSSGEALGEGAEPWRWVFFDPSGIAP